jgi:hypothetical protein
MLVLSRLVRGPLARGVTELVPELAVATAVLLVSLAG